MFDCLGGDRELFTRGPLGIVKGDGSTVLVDGWEDALTVTAERVPSPKLTPLPSTYDLIHARILRGFPDLVRELGGNSAALLARAGIDGART